MKNYQSQLTTVTIADNGATVETKTTSNLSAGDMSVAFDMFMLAIPKDAKAISLIISENPNECQKL